MAQGPMSSILVTIRITVRIKESEVRNLDSLDYRLCQRSAEVCALRAHLVINTTASGRMFVTSQIFNSAAAAGTCQSIWQVRSLYRCCHLSIPVAAYHAQYTFTGTLRLLVSVQSDRNRSQDVSGAGDTSCVFTFLCHVINSHFSIYLQR